MYNLIMSNDYKNNSQHHLAFTTCQVLLYTFHVLLIKKKKNPDNSPILQGTTQSRKDRCVWRLIGVSPAAGGNPEEEVGNGRCLALQAPLAIGCLLSPGTSLALDDRASKLSLTV